MNIQKEDRRFVLYIDDEEQGELTFHERSGIWVLTHTYTNPSLRGQGMAGKLMDAVMEAAAREDKQVLPLCSYAVHYLEEHPQYADRVVGQVG